MDWTYLALVNGLRPSDFEIVLRTAAGAPHIGRRGPGTRSKKHVAVALSRARAKATSLSTSLDQFLQWLRVTCGPEFVAAAVYHERACEHCGARTLQMPITGGLADLKACAWCREPFEMTRHAMTRVYMRIAEVQHRIEPQFKPIKHHLGRRDRRELARLRRMIRQDADVSAGALAPAAGQRWEGARSELTPGLALSYVNRLSQRECRYFIGRFLDFKSHDLLEVELGVTRSHLYVLHHRIRAKASAWRQLPEEFAMNLRMGGHLGSSRASVEVLKKWSCTNCDEHYLSRDHTPLPAPSRKSKARRARARRYDEAPACPACHTRCVPNGEITIRDIWRTRLPNTSPREAAGRAVRVAMPPLSQVWSARKQFVQPDLVSLTIPRSVSTDRPLAPPRAARSSRRAKRGRF